jgi:hypothetical protein
MANLKDGFRTCLGVVKTAVCVVGVALLCLPAATAWPETAAAVQPPGLDQITVEARRQRAIIEREVGSYVSAITVAPFQESLARWRTAVCPLVAGLPRDHGEFILRRISQIAGEAGVPLATEQCRGNFYVVVTADPDALLKAWTKRDVTMLGDAHGARGFLKSTSPVRVWYNANLQTAEGLPLIGDATSMVPTGRSTNYPLENVPNNTHAMGFRLAHDEVRDLISVIVLIDSGRAKGVSFGQLADYVALIGLAELRLDANLGGAPTILRLFGQSAQAPPPGLSSWDQSFLNALYHTEQTDKMQLSEIKIEVARDAVRDVVPKAGH